MLQCITALVKEPRPTELIGGFLEEHPVPVKDRKSSFYTDLCEHMCKGMDGVKAPGVWKNLNQQGSQRGKVPAAIPSPRRDSGGERIHQWANGSK